VPRPRGRAPSRLLAERSARVGQRRHRARTSSKRCACAA
jgi:hypothetical protein